MGFTYQPNHTINVPQPQQWPVEPEVKPEVEAEPATSPEPDLVPA